MSRGVKFTWPGIKAGAFRRLDDGQTGTVVVAWEHPQLEDQSEKLIGFKVKNKNSMLTQNFDEYFSRIAFLGKYFDTCGSNAW